MNRIVLSGVATTGSLSAHDNITRIFARFGGVARPAYRLAHATLDFGALHEAARQLLPQLARLPRAVERPPVLIWGHRDIRYPVAYWACLLGGFPLVPVEPETPPERVRQIAQTCDACGMLVADPDETVAARFAGMADPDTFAILPVADPLGVKPCQSPLTDAARLDAGDDDVAYIMFSSGSLGQPKGIKITYANLVDFIGWLDFLFPDAQAHRAVSGNIRNCFDVSLFELWMSWRMLLPMTALDHADLADSTGYVARLARDRVSLWVSTPSIMRLMLSNPRFSGRNLPELSTFLFCGETLGKPVVAALFDKFPGCQVINTYGPTECTVAVCATEITPADLAAAEELPIGWPRPGTQMASGPIDGRDGSTGEILIRGRSVGRGYVRLPERQARAFPEPRLYRTGDEGLRGPDGRWYFRGRLDREVKVQGVRIDLAEIEAQVRRLPGIEDVVVEPYVLRGEARALQAFVLGATTEGELQNLALTLGRELPPYLVPRYWFAGFPVRLNANSKLDRSQLAAAARDASLRYVHMPKAVEVARPPAPVIQTEGATP
ncbi:MAG: AMP-binding protein [Paracoccaceae bacterium]